MSAEIVAEYLNFFGDQEDHFCEHFPPIDTPRGPREHLSYDAAIFSDNGPHPCWCNPEMIYFDPIRNNKVWVHKRAQ